MYKKPRISDYYTKSTNEAVMDIKREDDERILNADKDELVDYFFDKYRLKKMEIKDGFEATQDKTTRIVRSQERHVGYRGDGDKEVEVKYIDLQVGLKKNPDIRKLTEKFWPSTMSISWTPNDFEWAEQGVSVRVIIKDYGTNLSKDKIKKEIKKYKDRIKQYIEWANDDIEEENEKLRQKIEQTIENRRDELKKDNDLLNELSEEIDIPLKKKSNKARKRVGLSATPLVKNIKPDPKTPVEYKLDRGKVIDVLSIIENQGEQFEKTPCTFDGSGEEDFRNIFLVNLNSVFEGAATGETFQNKGKTDIYLNIEKGNILVFECKIWGGKIKYQEAIKQLLRYLTWKNNFGIMITFSRNKNFSNVLKETRAAIKGSESYTKGFKIEEDNHFISQHSFNNEDEKQVEVHHLIYNIYCEE
jgi:ElaB/YqjD/DUF883 family membrane-anchored ribosome-binding protein